MSRNVTMIRWIGLLALCLGLLATLTPASAATPGGMVGWGSNQSGSLCLGNLPPRQLVPTAAIGAAASGVVAVAAGGYYSLALKADGTIVACGLNRDYGTLGIGVTDENNHPTPQQVVGISGATAIAAGQYHNLAVVGGSVYTWGKNANGQLGQGTVDTLAHPTPAAISGLSGVKAVAAGTNTSFAIKTDDTLWSWGRNTFGELSFSGATDRATPQQVFLSPGVPLLAKAVAGGDHHTAVVATNGTVYTFGGNGEGELGIGTTDPLPHPSPSPLAALGSQNTAVVAGFRHTLALADDGTVRAWGEDNIGQLGRGVATTTGCTCQTIPVGVGGLSGVQALGAGQQHSLALLTDGTVRAWGRGTNGEHGNGVTSNSATPVPVSGLTDAVAIATGPYAQQSLAIILGPAPSPSPVPVPSFADVPPGYWAYSQIGQFAARGITTGCDTDRYCPERPVTRAEMAVFIDRTLGYRTPPTPTSQRFSDVPPTYWAYAFIDQFATLGITTGCGGTEFCPDRGVTRAEMAAFLIRALKQGQVTPATPTFADVPASHPQYSYIEALVVAGATTGCGADAQGRKLYCPDNNVTRAEMAVFIIRAYP